MKFISLRPMIWTEDFQETIEFYSGQLGFTCQERNDDWGWASLQRDDVEIMIAKPNEHAGFERPNFTGSFYIRTDNVDGLWEEFKDRHRLVYEIENFEWNMREFAIYDNNGYIIQFGQEINPRDFKPQP
jgi:catechol 2,3-dioxygenase-like lactoylglutathione lyase family enzyme